MKSERNTVSELNTHTETHTERERDERRSTTFHVPLQDFKSEKKLKSSGHDAKLTTG